MGLGPKWEKNNYQGIIEAVTGSGKTRIAHEAMLNHLKLGYCVLIIVPTTALLEQWRIDIEEMEDTYIKSLINSGQLELLGGDNKPNLRHWRILISTVQSAMDRNLPPQGKGGLLIADECHWYGAPKYSKALKEPYLRRLGLTATCERNDDGIEKYLYPYFGGKVSTFSYRDALAEKVISPFKFSFFGVELTHEEREDYDKCNFWCWKYKKKLIENYGVVEKPFGDFFRTVSLLKKNGNKDAGYFLSNFTKKRKLLAKTVNKYNSISNLADIIKSAKRTIVFSQTQDASEKVIEPLKNKNINADFIHSGMNEWDREQVLIDFKTGDIDVVAAPKVLDEGINVPSADLAIIMASSKSKRQMIQRTGRVLRKEEGKIAKILVMYAKDTSEDPESDANECFLEVITNAVGEDNIRKFDDNTINDLKVFFSPIDNKHKRSQNNNNYSHGRVIMY